MKLTAANSIISDQAFQVLQPDGFFVPYGDIPHKKGLQKFDRASAEEMQAAFNSVLGKLTNFFTGVPVYVGHPDVPEVADKWPDKKAYGWVRGIEPREDGCFFAAAMNDAGRELIESKSFAYYSPFWDCKPVSGGIRPVWLRSIGLTNNPNILVPALANEAEPESADAATISTDNEPETTTTMLDKIMAALIAAGIVKEGDDENCVLKQIGNMISSLAYERDEKARQESQIAKMRAALANESETDLGALITAACERIEAANEELRTKNQELSAAAANEAELTAAKSALDEARATLAAARAHRIEFALENAITTARLSPADRDAQRTTLTAIANDTELTSALDKLREADVKLKTTSETVKLGKEGKAISAANESAAKDEARRAEIEKCKERFPSLQGGQLYEAAYNAARVAKPDLF